MVAGCHLSERELAVLGVKRITNKYGKLYYSVPCDVCGKHINTTRYNTAKIYRCYTCENKRAVDNNKIKKLAIERVEFEESQESGVDYDHYHRFESAVWNLEPKYLFAIQEAEKFRDKFGSVPEVLACVELLYIGARVIPQQKVGSYSVDFCLPDEKVVIEIDGSLYHANKDKEYRRDLVLMNALGSNWEIKHIPAESVKKNHALFGRMMKRYLDDRRFVLNVKPRKKKPDTNMLE